MREKNLVYFICDACQINKETGIPCTFQYVTSFSVSDTDRYKTLPSCPRIETGEGVAPNWRFLMVKDI